MKAAVLREFGRPLRIEEVPKPLPEPDEVLVKVEACGVCHSDLHVIDGDQAGFKAMTKQALIPGHEVVGRVVQTGSSVRGLHVGDRVGVAWMHASCGACDQCREGRENLCRRFVITGVMVDGGYAQFMRAKASHAIPVPDALGPIEAAPLFCAGVTVYRALRNAGVKSEQRVAVVGIGGLGHLAVQVARALGAEVLALDVAEDKLELARELGASTVLNVADPQAVKAVRQSGGAHVAIMTSAANAAFDTALKCLRPAGTLSVVGVPPDALAFSALALVTGEFRVTGSAVGTRDDLRATLALGAAGKVRSHTETAPVDRVNEVLERMRRGAITGRVVLTFE
ncbi:MAG: hypothetical protein A3G25_10595 [Betaproteobacteria bacterium RIFCSPLOWO2_12_FULL_63_13]|nr:MAG: hypothetical protein A3H32_04525 [Betaproteobacteria bacterium RIFCSPLOWO2_02_FULL_63_19]OGA43243.1 MAG: hypothetical protein A3G25_10595 [Betaproteobacteria bacterium RIFCSPLOWO2_12_FULL_63_13]